MEPTIPEYFKRFFEDGEQEYLAQSLIGYAIFDVKPKITPAIWQDVQIYIRFKQRDVWYLNGNQVENAKYALMLYRIKYIIEHLKPAEIVKLLNDLFSKENEFERHQTLPVLLEERFHAPLDKLIMTQEKRIVRKDDLKIFDSLFEYPAWLEFDDEATRTIYDKIMKDEFTDEQIDYFLGAADTLKNYDELLPVVKYVLATTNNFHTFWVAADVLNIIWHAVPEEEKAQKWFRDEIFSIFWPRVETPWLLSNVDMINLQANDEAKIVDESIKWLKALSDLPERVPEIDPKQFKCAYKSIKSDTQEITEIAGGIKALIGNNAEITKVLPPYYDISERVELPEQLEVLEKTKDCVVEFVNTFPDGPDRKKVLSEVNGAFKHAKKYTAHVARESERLLSAFVNI